MFAEMVLRRAASSSASRLSLGRRSQRWASRHLQTPALADAKQRNAERDGQELADLEAPTSGAGQEATTDDVGATTAASSAVDNQVRRGRTADHRELFGTRKSSHTTTAVGRLSTSRQVHKESVDPQLATQSSRRGSTEEFELPAKVVERAKQSVLGLLKLADKTTPPVPDESPYQRSRRQQKAITRHLDNLLWRLRQLHDYDMVEAVADVWEDVFPQFSGVVKHRMVISENLALALNQQQRFDEVVDRFLAAQIPDRALDGSAEVNTSEVMMSPLLGDAIFVACGHVGDSTGALILRGLLNDRDIRISMVSYFHLLNALIKDESFDDCDMVLRVCEEMVARMPSEHVPLSLLPTILTMAAEDGLLERAMRLYHHPKDVAMSSYTEFRFETCAQTLWELHHEAEMMQVYNGVMSSTTASRDFQTQLSKGLLRKVLSDVTGKTRADHLAVARELIEVMEAHRISASPQVVSALLNALLVPGDGDEINSAAALQEFFEQYPHVFEWNAFSVCEAVTASVKCRRVQMVDDLIVYALDRHIPIKYRALESVVAFYYKLGMMGDLERVADIVRALRLNKHIPLGIAVTEIGMSANYRLGRYEEVIHLFEDFSAADGDRRRVLTRRLMLKSAQTAYAALRRSDEANALQKLLDESYENLLGDPTPDIGDDVDEDGDDINNPEDLDGLWGDLDAGTPPPDPSSDHVDR